MAEAQAAAGGVPRRGLLHDTLATRHEIEALEVRARTYLSTQLEQMDDWEGALRGEWVSLVSRNLLIPRYQMEGTLEDGTTTSESIQTTPAFQG